MNIRGWQIAFQEILSKTEAFLKWFALIAFFFSPLLPVRTVCCLFLGHTYQHFVCGYRQRRKLEGQQEARGF